MKRLFLVLPFLLPLCSHAQSQMWNNLASSLFATCLARGDHGDLWAGADDEGLFHSDAHGQWSQVATGKELGDSNVTCITVDHAHRVWVGTASAGVAVYDGANWKHYGVWTGPLSSRINALKTDSTGTVWGATDTGLFSWNGKDGWRYPGVFASDEVTRRLARRPIYALAIESPTSLLEATDSGLIRLTLTQGVARIAIIGKAASKIQPPRVQGTEFLPGPVHDVALDSLGHIWCATRFGVCISKNKGATWRFLRGADWKENVSGSAVPLALDTSNAPDDALSEDWVTTLSPTNDGKMWLGFRQKGAEERDCRTLELLVATRDDPRSATSPAFGGDWTSAIVPLDSDTAAFARYGGGLASLFGVNLPVGTTVTAQPSAPWPQPSTFSPRLLAFLTANLKTSTPLAVGQGTFYNLDRETRGDWPLRYGNEAAELEGLDEDDTTFGAIPVQIDTGPHHNDSYGGDYTYTTWDSSNNPNVLQLPAHNKREQSEVNDGTWQDRQYPFSFDGPDLWVSFGVPQSLHRVALYWFNKDGHSDTNRMRDHRIELFPGALTKTQCLRREPLAKARFWSGWNGEYASFAVRGPAKFQIRLARDRSHGTILQGVFFDHLGARQARPRWLPARFKMPPSPKTEATPALMPALSLWQACQLAETRGTPCSLERLVALRAAQTAGAPEQLLAAWRVQTVLWDEAGQDRQAVALPNQSRPRS